MADCEFCVLDRRFKVQKASMNTELCLACLTKALMMESNSLFNIYSEHQAKNYDINVKLCPVACPCNMKARKDHAKKYYEAQSSDENFMKTYCLTAGCKINCCEKCAKNIVDRIQANE